MQPFVIDRKSWHYQIIEMNKDAFYEDPTDFCAYVKKFFWSMVSLAIMSALLFSVSFALGNMVVSLLFSAYYGIWVMTEFGMAAITLLAGLLFAVVLVLLFIGAQQVGRHDNFASTAAKSFFQKYCVRVEYK
jgi:hypothetical protein